MGLALSRAYLLAPTSLSVSPSFTHALSCICQVLCLVMGKKKQWPVSPLWRPCQAPSKTCAFPCKALPVWHCLSCLVLPCVLLCSPPDSAPEYTNRLIPHFVLLLSSCSRPSPSLPYLDPKAVQGHLLLSPLHEEQCGRAVIGPLKPLFDAFFLPGLRRITWT